MNLTIVVMLRRKESITVMQNGPMKTQCLTGYSCTVNICGKSRLYHRLQCSMKSWLYIRYKNIDKNAWCLTCHSATSCYKCLRCLVYSWSIIYIEAAYVTADYAAVCVKHIQSLWKGQQPTVSAIPMAASGMTHGTEKSEVLANIMKQSW